MRLVGLLRVWGTSEFSEGACTGPRAPATPVFPTQECSARHSDARVASCRPSPRARSAGRHRATGYHHPPMGVGGSPYDAAEFPCSSLTDRAFPPGERSPSCFL